MACTVFLGVTISESECQAIILTLTLPALPRQGHTLLFKWRTAPGLPVSLGNRWY